MHMHMRSGATPSADGADGKGNIPLVCLSQVFRHTVDENGRV